MLTLLCPSREKNKGERQVENENVENVEKHYGALQRALDLD